jgi:hypothetical protein
MDPIRAVPIPAAAHLLGISRAHGFRLAAAGVLPTVRLSDRVRRVPLVALARLLNEARPTPPPGPDAR